MMKSVKLLLLLTSFLCFSQIDALAQMDPVTVDLQFEEIPDSLNPDLSLGHLKVMVTVNDTTFFGRASVDLYHATDGRYIKSIVLDKSMLLAQGLIIGNTFTVTFEYLVSGIAYKVETTLQNQDLFYFPPITIIYNP